MRYTSIHIIFNPNSTGPSRDYAKELEQQLKKIYPDTSIDLQATKYAGHAEELAYKLASSSEQPLLVSSSGDGGYNEVINGAIRAQQAGATPTCAVLAAGNANDHSRTVQSKPLIDLINTDQTTFLDLLKVTLEHDKTIVRYAHSYIGLGLTPVVAVELNKTNLNALKELWIVLRTFAKHRPFKIKKDGEVIALDSILFTNIGEMAKVLTVSKNAEPDDGLFEVVTFPHAHKLKLLGSLIRATADGLEQKKQYKKYKFEAQKRMPFQFDGEVHFVEKGTTVTVDIAPRVLRTIT